MLCAELNASMDELLDFEGKWSIELLETMLPVAIKRRAERNLDDFVSRIRSFGALLSSKVVKEVIDQYEEVDGAITNAMRAVRDLEPIATHPAVDRKQKRFMDDLDSVLGKVSTHARRGGRRRSKEK